MLCNTVLRGLMRRAHWTLLTCLVAIFAVFVILWAHKTCSLPNRIALKSTWFRDFSDTVASSRIRSLGCAEIWFNRYQGFLGNILGSILAIFAAVIAGLFALHAAKLSAEPGRAQLAISSLPYLKQQIELLGNEIVLFQEIIRSKNYLLDSTSFVKTDNSNHTDTDTNQQLQYRLGRFLSLWKDEYPKLRALADKYYSIIIINPLSKEADATRLRAHQSISEMSTLYDVVIDIELKWKNIGGATDFIRSRKSTFDAFMKTTDIFRRESDDLLQNNAIIIKKEYDAYKAIFEEARASIELRF